MSENSVTKGSRASDDLTGNIWALVVDDGTSVKTTLHASRKSAIDYLVLTFDHVDPDDPVHSLRYDYSYMVYLNSHPLPTAEVLSESDREILRKNIEAKLTLIQGDDDIHTTGTIIQRLTDLAGIEYSIDDGGTITLANR